MLSPSSFLKNISGKWDLTIRSIKRIEFSDEVDFGLADKSTLHLVTDWLSSSQCLDIQFSGVLAGVGMSASACDGQTLCGFGVGMESQKYAHMYR